MNTFKYDLSLFLSSLFNFKAANTINIITSINNIAIQSSNA